MIVADDDPAHLDLLRELLTPIGFELHSAPDGVACLQTAASVAPDLALLDLQMPGKNGWEVAEAMRAMNGRRTAIIIVSANVDELPKVHEFHDMAFVVKPIDVQLLLSAIQQAIGLEWIYEQDGAAPQTAVAGAPAAPIAAEHLDDLHQLGNIGYVRGIEAKLDEIVDANPAHGAVVADLRALVRNFELKRYMATVEALRDRVAP
ncbi:MAG: response regulator [Rhodospirillaceae bacterium]|nr:response regulator [Rhodospirillaceae bacterium]